LADWTSAAQRGADPAPPVAGATLPANCTMAFHMFRYLARHDGREREFVRAFPTSKDGVVYTERQIEPNIRPRHLLFADLSLVAQGGDSEASKKLILLFDGKTDGELADLIADGISRIALKKPQLLGAALNAVPSRTRQFALRSRDIWCIVRNWKDTAARLAAPDASILAQTARSCGRR
jgi:hypothetical protein